MRWNIKVVATAAIIILLAFAIAATLTLSKKPRLQPSAGIGGPFSLIDQRGKPVTEKDYLGKPMLVFFGFTFCPDVCPTTLMEMTERLKELGPRADQLNVLFITVDPSRDTPEQLALYLSSFDPRITGLSGNERDIDAVMSRYRVYARKVPLADGGYTMDHTATVYMMNPKGEFVGIISYQEPSESVRTKIRRLLDDASHY
jgi:protein SCO1/2